MTTASNLSAMTTRISEFFFPPVARPIGNMADLRATKAPAQTRSKPISARSLKQQAGDDGASLEKKASRPVPWATRFQLLVFSVRLRLSSGGSSAQALKAEIKAFKTASSKAELPGVVKELDGMLMALNEKNALANSGIPLAGGPRFRY